MNDVLTLPAQARQLREIRNVLGVYFPKTHFEMNTYNNAGYKVIEVEYTDGISLIRVKNAVKGFDLRPNPEIHQLGMKVIVIRTMSERTKKLLLAEIKSVFAMKNLPGENDWFEPIQGTIRAYMDKIFNMRDFE